MSQAISRCLVGGLAGLLVGLVAVACRRGDGPTAWPVNSNDVEASASSLAEPDAARPVGASEDASSPLDAAPPMLAGFVASGTGEAVRLASGDDGRSYTNVPYPFDPDRPTEVVVYATPNGNTLEQTLGRRRAEGDSFRYDIQHVLAQVRLYRTLVPSSNVVLVTLEAPALSWPTWRKRRVDAPARASALVLQAAPFAPGATFTLASHSGGGALTFALLDSAPRIPDRVSRIVFLDSHYGFDDKSGHGNKLSNWLGASPAHRLTALAYDDRRVRLHGKLVVPPGGGSYRATYRLLHALEASRLAFEQDEVGPFLRYRSGDGRADLRVHPNPKNIILHSALVSDENGLVFALAQGRGAQIEARAPFGRPRIYEAFVDASGP